MSAENKEVKTFRLSLGVIELVRKAAERAGISEGDLIESCILAQAEQVVSQVRAKRAFLGTPAAVDAVAVAGTGRPRERRLDAGVPRGQAKKPTLTKRQQN